VFITLQAKATQIETQNFELNSHNIILTDLNKQLVPDNRRYGFSQTRFENATLMLNLATPRLTRELSRLRFERNKQIQVRFPVAHD
jgi:hypothetical protein